MINSIESQQCAGCGVLLQTTNEKKTGYVPQSAINQEILICQRCFRIKHYNEVAQVSIDDKEFTRILDGIGATNSLVVKVVDIFDFNGSWLNGLHRYVGQNPILLVGNKVDLLPKGINPNRLVNWMKYEGKQHGLRPVDVILCSAKQNIGLQQLVESMAHHRNNQDIYVVGATNVGKSTLINSLLKQYGEVDMELTTSRFPGTTLDMIEIPLDDDHSLFDTPGIINRDQIVHMLAPEDLKTVSPEKRINPKVFQLNDQQTLFLGGMARFDFVKGDRQPFVVYISNELNIHRTKLDKADELYENHVGEKILTPPHKESMGSLPAMQRHTFKINPGEKVDIVVSGLGWVTVGDKGAVMDVHAPKGVSVITRNALI